MAKIAITSAIVLLCFSVQAQADGHADAEAKIAQLQHDKKVLATRLSNAIAYSKNRKAMLDATNKKQMAMSAGITNAMALSKKRSTQTRTLQQQLDAEKQRSKMLDRRLKNAIAYSKERKAQLDVVNTKQSAMTTAIAGALANSKKRSAQIRTLQQQLDSEKHKSKTLGRRLNNAVAFSKERKAQLDVVNTKQSAMTTAIAGAIAQSKRRAAQTRSMQQQLDSETKKRMMLGNRLQNAIAYSTKLEGQINSQQQQQSDWASAVSANLDAAIGGVQGTTVTSIDDSVNIQVGNNGLFSTGGVALSRSGSQLLSTIAQQISGLGANVMVVGHTDNVPVGKNRRYSSNDELSLARALSTLAFLRGQGIQTEQLSAAGFGAGSPIAGNDTAEGRAQNRRVEIVLRQR